MGEARGTRRGRADRVGAAVLTPVWVMGFAALYPSYGNVDVPRVMLRVGWVERSETHHSVMQGKRSEGKRRGRRTGIRLHRRRRRFGRLRAGQPADRGWQDHRPAARSRRQGSRSVDPHTRRLLPQHLQPQGRLEFRIGTGARIQQPPHTAAARQGARRLLVDQRPDLHPRPEAGLRPVAPTWQHRVVLRRRAAVFPQVGGPGARRERVPRQGRPARGVRSAHRSSAARCVRGGREAGGLSVQSGLQRRRTGRRRPAAAYRAQSQALLHRGRLFEAGDDAAQPDRWRSARWRIVS